MAVTEVLIANLALSKVGADSTIASMTETSAEAEQCELWMDRARRQALAAFNWDFARVRATLVAHGDDPPDTWAYRYVYPADCLKALEIENPAGKQADKLAYKVEQSTDGTKSILTDQNTAILIYTTDDDDPTLYSEWFIETLTSTLGSKIAFNLTGRTNLAAKLRAEARQMAILAPAMDATEKQESPPRDAEHTRGRD